jgi:hypothetical protein
MANATPVNSGKRVKVAKRNTARPVRLRTFAAVEVAPEEEIDEHPGNDPQPRGKRTGYRKAQEASRRRDENYKGKA